MKEYEVIRSFMDEDNKLYEANKSTITCNEEKANRLKGSNRNKKTYIGKEVIKEEKPKKENKETEQTNQ